MAVYAIVTTVDMTTDQVVALPCGTNIDTSVPGAKVPAGTAINSVVWDGKSNYDPGKGLTLVYLRDG